MRQVFRSLPWVLPPDPPTIVEIFKKHGREESLAKGQAFRHGGRTGNVYYLVKGLVTFSFVDIHSHSHIFAVVFPGCALGDLDSLPMHAPSVIAECLKPCKVLTLSILDYQKYLRESVEVMEAYAHMCVKKEEAIIEGAFSNFTLDLETRLRLLFYSILRQGQEGDFGKEGYFASLMQEGITLQKLPWTPTITAISQILSANRSWLSTKISEWLAAGFIVRQDKDFLCRTDLFLPLRSFKSSTL